MNRARRCGKSLTAASQPADNQPMRASFQQRIADENGQTLVMAALAMVVLVGFLGLSIDVGQLRYHKRLLQNAADAAALAGALELNHCGGVANCGAMRVAAQNAMVENGFTGSILLTRCGGGTGQRLELLLTNPPCANANDPHAGSSAYVEAIVSEPQPTLFARVLGISQVLLMARGEAARSGRGACVYALDPNGSGALTMDRGATLTADCGVVVESSSSRAMDCTAASVTVPSVAIHGGYAGSCGFNRTPVTGAARPKPADPLATLPTPAMPACGTSTASPYHGASNAVSITGNATLYPDSAYCGGLSIAAGAQVNFMPGVYVLSSSKGAGGLTIDLGASITGSGVMLYNAGPSGSITFKDTGGTGGTGVALVAPTSGTYAGVLFFQDQRNTTQATLLGASDRHTVLEGAAYFPAAKVLYAYDGSAAYNILVAYDLEFERFVHATTTNTQFHSNYASLANGSPVAGAAAGVVE